MFSSKENEVLIQLIEKNIVKLTGDIRYLSTAHGTRSTHKKRYVEELSHMRNILEKLNVSAQKGSDK